MIRNRKEDGRVCTVHVIRKSPTPSENWLTAILNWKKPKSDPGFEPGLPRQNAIALSLVPPPLPIHTHTSTPMSITYLLEMITFCSCPEMLSQNLLLLIQRSWSTTTAWPATRRSTRPSSPSSPSPSSSGSCSETPATASSSSCSLSGKLKLFSFN